MEVSKNYATHRMSSQEVWTPSFVFAKFSEVILKEKSQHHLKSKMQ